MERKFMEKLNRTFVVTQLNLKKFCFLFKNINFAKNALPIRKSLEHNLFFRKIKLTNKIVSLWHQKKKQELIFTQ